MKPSFSKLLFVIACAVCVACGPKAQTQAERQYALTGKVVSLDAKAHTANIDAAAMPGFMDAIAMDYPVPSQADFNALRVGEKIKATVNVKTSGDYYLTNVQEDGASK